MKINKNTQLKKKLLEERNIEMAALTLKVLCAMIVISLTSHFAHSAKILILATVGGSQYVRMRNVAEELGTR